MTSITATLVSEGKVTQGKFGFRLSVSGTSELYLGGADSSHYSGSITYTPVTQQAYWQVALGAVTTNSKSVVASGARQAIIDTGTTLIYTNKAGKLIFCAQSFLKRSPFLIKFDMLYRCQNILRQLPFFVPTLYLRLRCHHLRRILRYPLFRFHSHQHRFRRCFLPHQLFRIR